MTDPYGFDPRGRDRQRSWIDRRRDKIVAEIQANRRGENRVPTWVLTLCLIAMILAILAVLYYA